MNPVTFYKSLADDGRLKCLLLLRLKKRLSVGELQQALHLPQPKISRYLLDLRKQGIVESEREGQRIFYVLAAQLPTWCQDVLLVTAGHNGQYLSRCLARLNLSP